MEKKRDLKEKSRAGLLQRRDYSSNKGGRSHRVIRDKGKDPSTLPSARLSAADTEEKTVRRATSRAGLRPATSHPVPKTQHWGQEGGEESHPAQLSSQKCAQGFPGGAVDKSPPANVGDMGSIPGLGRYCMLQSN